MTPDLTQRARVTPRVWKGPRAGCREILPRPEKPRYPGRRDLHLDPSFGGEPCYPGRRVNSHATRAGGRVGGEWRVPGPRGHILRPQRFDAQCENGHFLRKLHGNRAGPLTCLSMAPPFWTSGNDASRGTLSPYRTGPPAGMACRVRLEGCARGARAEVPSGRLQVPG